MLMVVSHPLRRHRHAVTEVMPICFNHAARLITAGLDDVFVFMPLFLIHHSG